MGCSRLSNVHARQRGYIFNRMASPVLKEKQQPANGTPPQVRAATRQRAATHVRGGVPDAPETFCRRPSPGKPPGRACPAPTARRWASPMPSVNAHGGVKTPPYGPSHQRVPTPRRKFARPHVNGQPTHVGGGVPDAPETFCRRPSPGKPPGRACPAPTARRRASPLPSANARGGVKTPPYGLTHQRGARTPPQVRAATRQRAATHVGGGVPYAPETSRHRPSPGKPPGRACPAPTARRWASPMPSANAHGGVKTPPYEPPHQRVPAPRRAAVRERRQKNRGDPFSRDCLGSLYKHISA